MSLPIRVLLADDSEIVRDTIRSRLGCESGVAIVGEVASYRELVRVLSQCAPQVVLLDMHMPDEGKYAPEFIKALLSHFCVLAMSAWDDAGTKAIAKRYGALKLLEKSELGKCLTAAIQDCAHKSKSPTLHDEATLYLRPDLNSLLRLTCCGGRRREGRAAPQELRHSNQGNSRHPR